MRKRSRERILSPHGQNLYQLDRNATGIELTVEEFADQKICGAPKDVGECLFCSEYRPLIARTFCLRCTAGALKDAA